MKSAICSYSLNSELNPPNTQAEVQNAIRLLKVGSSAGTDEILAEMIKSAEQVILPLLLSLLNAIFDHGVYPDIWSEAIIVPIHKRGPNDNPDNYRGIALSSALSKVFTHILSRRLQKWADLHDLIREEQAGFSTVDNIFVLHSIISKYLRAHKKLYVGFVDFKKAFDTVNRNILWNILRKNGVSGKILNVLIAMYRSARYCIRRCEGQTDSSSALKV